MLHKVPLSAAEILASATYPPACDIPMPGNHPTSPSIGGSLGQYPRQPIPLTFEETMRLLANPVAFESRFVGANVHAAASLTANGGATGRSGLPPSEERQSVPSAPKRLFDTVEQSEPLYLTEITSPSASVVNKRSIANPIKTDGNLNAKSKRARRAPTSTPTSITPALRRTRKPRIKKSMPTNPASSSNLDSPSNASLDKEQQSETTMRSVSVIQGVQHATSAGEHDVSFVISRHSVVNLSDENLVIHDLIRRTLLPATSERLAAPGFGERALISSINNLLPSELNILTGNSGNTASTTFGGPSGQLVPESQSVPVGPMITSQKVGLSGLLTSRESSVTRMEHLSSTINSDDDPIKGSQASTDNPKSSTNTAVVDEPAPLSSNLSAGSVVGGTGSQQIRPTSPPPFRPTIQPVPFVVPELTSVLKKANGGVPSSVGHESTNLIMSTQETDHHISASKNATLKKAHRRGRIVADILPQSAARAA